MSCVSSWEWTWKLLAAISQNPVSPASTNATEHREMWPSTRSNLQRSDYPQRVQVCFASILYHARVLTMHAALELSFNGEPLYRTSCWLQPKQYWPLAQHRTWTCQSYAKFCLCWFSESGKCHMTCTPATCCRKSEMRTDITPSAVTVSLICCFSECWLTSYIGRFQVCFLSRMHCNFSEFVLSIWMYYIQAHPTFNTGISILHTAY